MGTLKINKGGTDYTPQGFKIRLGGTEYNAQGFWMKVQGTWRWVGFGGTPTNGNLEASGFSYASITWNSNGSSTGGGNWVNPIGSGSGLYLKLTHTSDSAPSGSALNTWLAMTSNRFLELGHPTLQLRSSGNYYVSTGGSDASIVGSGTWLLRVTQGIEE